jgi:hypothetical protein
MHSAMITGLDTFLELFLSFLINLASAPKPPSFLNH